MRVIARAAAPERKLTIAPEQTRKSEPAAPSRPFVSPFAADSARKGTPRSEASPDAGTPSRSTPAAVSTTPVVMGAAVAAQPAPAAAAQPAMKIESQSAGIDEVRSSVLNALTSAGQSMLCSMLVIMSSVVYSAEGEGDRMSHQTNFLSSPDVTIVQPLGSL